MRCIVERLLPDRHERTYLQREMVNEEVVFQPATKSYHVYCSKRNPGALKLLEEFAGHHGLNLNVESSSKAAPSRRRCSAKATRRKQKRAQTNTLHVTQDIEQLGECDFMLVYLTSQTWTRADESSMLGVEVGGAMDAGVSLLLAHEMIGVGGQEARYGCEFAKFFSCDDGATPVELLQRGIYAKIAVALKGGEWRKTSMVMLAKAFGGSDAVNKEDVDELKSAQEMSKTAQQELSRLGVVSTAAARGRAAASTAASTAASSFGRLSDLMPVSTSLLSWRSSRVRLMRSTPRELAIEPRASEV